MTHLQSMDLWQLHCAIQTLVATRHILSLQAAAMAQTQDDALVAWAQDHEREIEQELETLAREMARRSPADPDDRDIRRMALARATGLVPAEITDLAERAA